MQLKYMLASLCIRNTQKGKQALLGIVHVRVFGNGIVDHQKLFRAAAPLKEILY
jgi:hypothetical protein